MGFNDQTTFKNVLASDVGQTDWLAFDDDPSETCPTTQMASRVKIGHTSKAQVSAALQYLNFGNQLDTLYGTGIVQGGIGTGPGQVAINQILSDLDYSDTSLVDLSGSDGTYLLNQEGLIPVAAQLDSLTQLGQSFNNTWAVRQKQAPLNFSHSLSLGSQTKLFGRPLGYIFGLRWGQSSQHYENGEYGRYAGGNIEGTDSLGLERYYDDTRSDISYKWNALANLSYKINEFNKSQLDGDAQHECNLLDPPTSRFPSFHAIRRNSSNKSPLTRTRIEHLPDAR